ncbi:hypothetical protein JKF63_05576 [Porcisia hertigi]|uniref:Uncharacterized protein n=1 Tax=Porcisia hertigi TaxID=2761500 RepID=A0A836LAY3_9TRYP|nr:hypothetical protein JKF63_05576 [Porcisia hertigi]
MQNGDGTAAGSSHLNKTEKELRYQTTMDTWLWPDANLRWNRAPGDEKHPGTGRHISPSTASQQLHIDDALNRTASVSGMLPPPIPSADRHHGDAGTRQPRLTTQVTSPPTPQLSAPLLATATSDRGDLENPAQSRIARQLQLLRNYRELAELCSSTESPSTDLFRALPSEDLARMQAEQLKELGQREHTPITVHNNYYFGNDRNGRGSGVHHMSGALTADSDIQGARSYHLHGGALSQLRQPPLPPSPRAVPLQSPQLSSGSDSPVATPPLSLRSGNLAPPSSSRSQRARSHCSRLLDAHHTPTATTEEAGSSYVDEDEEEDYVGDFMDNSGGEEDAYEEVGMGYRRPPPRIIEREQHRRFPNPSTVVDAFPFAAPGGKEQTQPDPNTSQLERRRQNSYPGDHASSPSLIFSENLRDASRSAPPGIRSGSARPEHDASQSSADGPPVSDGGKRSPSSIINVISGDQELRANAHRQSLSGRSNQEEHGPSQERHVSALSTNNAAQHPTAASSYPHHQHMRKSSVDSGSVVLYGNGAPTDTGVSPDYLSLRGPHRASREHMGSVKGDRGRNERGGRRRGADWDRDSNSVDHDADNGCSGTCGFDSDSSADDTPGNPQLQTRDPRSLTKSKRHARRRHSKPNNKNGRDNVQPTHGQKSPGRTHSSASRRVYGTQRTRQAGEVDDVRSAASYSCNYTTSSDISDYMPGSYYSPIRSRNPGGGRSGAPGGRRNNGGNFSREFQQLPQSSSSATCSPVAVQGRHRHGATTPGPRHGRAPGLAEPRGLSPQRLAYQKHDQQLRQAGLLPRPSTNMAGASAGPTSGAIRLSDGRVIPLASPEPNLYQNMVVTGVPGVSATAPRRMEQRVAFRPSASTHSSRPPCTARVSGRPSPSHPPQAIGSRTASPSVGRGIPTTARGNSGAGGSSVHIQTGLLYGSLLPKARPETALVVKEVRGRTCSVDPRGGANHAPLIERGSVCPVQPSSSNGANLLHLSSDDAAQVDIFPIASAAIHGSTRTGVQPLEWKSSGSGCVVGRSGHVPVAPRGKLSSHYVPPGSHKKSKHPGKGIAVNGSLRAASPSHPTDTEHGISVSPLLSSRPRYAEASAPAGMSNKLTQSRSGTLGGANAQQRYVPSQVSFQSAMGGHREASVQQPQNAYGSSNTTAATRNANARRFGITPLRE